MEKPPLLSTGGQEKNISLENLQVLLEEISDLLNTASWCVFDQDLKKKESHKNLKTTGRKR